MLIFRLITVVFFLFFFVFLHSDLGMWIIWTREWKVCYKWKIKGKHIKKKTLKVYFSKFLWFVYPEIFTQGKEQLAFSKGVNDFLPVRTGRFISNWSINPALVHPFFLSLLPQLILSFSACSFDTQRKGAASFKHIEAESEREWESERERERERYSTQQWIWISACVCTPNVSF